VVRTVAENPGRRTLFASYAKEDWEEVKNYLAFAHSVHLDVYEYQWRAQPGFPIRDTIVREIRDRDMFLLFWSPHARHSHWVATEIEVALECEKAGRPEIIPYLLRHMPVEELPPRLADRQFLNPFKLMMPYDKALEMQRGITTEPDASPLSAEMPPRVVDTRKHRRPPDEAGPGDPAPAP
jgi:TIR domain